MKHHAAIESNVVNEECLILGTIAPPDEQLLSTLLLSHTLKKERARTIIALLPYLAYARDEKAGQSLPTAWVGALLQASGVDEVSKPSFISAIFLTNSYYFAPHHTSTEHACPHTPSLDGPDVPTECKRAGESSQHNSCPVLALHTYA